LKSPRAVFIGFIIFFSQKLFTAQGCENYHKPVVYLPNTAHSFLTPSATHELGQAAKL
jgi:hypothetical protein